MSILRPSPAITISEHASIGETIQTLIDHKVGSVIITAYSEPHKPVGIFTERDLLKWVFDFKDKNIWHTAIGTIMTKRLITLDLSKIDQANELMISNNIRHIPIVFNGEDGVEHLAGVISMRDAFKALFVEKNTPLKESRQEDKNVSISLLVNNPRDQILQNKILLDHGSLQFLECDINDHNSISTVLKKVIHSSVFIFDIDHLSNHFWPLFLKSILAESGHPEVFLVYSPKLHDKKNI
jgi:CBS domain-containing protein